MKDKKDTRQQDQAKVDVEQLEELHREAVDSQGCSEVDLEAVSGGAFEA